MHLHLVTAAVLTFLLTAVGCPLLIKRMRALQFGQQVRDDGPARHSVKAGTPTMGGLLFIAAAVVFSLLIAGPSVKLWLALLVAIGSAVIGFLDDYLKIAGGRSLGLKARAKMAGEISIALLFIALLALSGLYQDKIALPGFTEGLQFGYLYPVVLFLLITGFSNSVNLTDGVDGLAAGTAVFAFIAFTVIAIQQDVLGIAVLSATLAAGCFAFLIYNRHPARLFMGDVGSLALGGAMAAIAILLKAEFYLLIIGAVYLIEAISVIAQVVSFQLRGKRILLMSPLHHHFELKGWSEWRVVILFWSAAFIFAGTGLLLYQV